MYVFIEAEDNPKKCDSCKMKKTPYAAYGKQTFTYDVVARRVCLDCFNALSIEEIMKALRVSNADSMEAFQEISEWKKEAK